MTQDASPASSAGGQEWQQPQQPVEAVKAAWSPRRRPEKNLYRPYNPPRFLWDVMRMLFRFIIAIVLDVHLYGRQIIARKSPFIIAANHLAWADIPLLVAFTPHKVVYMAKEEILHGKGSWFVRFAAFAVKRGEADRQALRAAEEQLKEGRVLVIFPEGTRSRIRQMAKGHAGVGMIALRSGVPVVPVAIWGSEDTFKKFRPRVTIRFGEPMILQPKGNKITREDIDEATEQVMRRIASMLPPEYRGVYAEG